jgi:hypothetical protein
MLGRRKIVAGWAAVLLGCAATARAQQPAQQGDINALQHGRLVVWVVKPTPPKAGQSPAPGQIPVQTPMGYEEQTAGSFGQSASSVGTSASNYGVSSTSDSIARVPAKTKAADPDGTVAAAAGYQEQTSGSYGQTSGSYGTAASNHGQTSSSLGQTASSYGTSASNYGQTAGSFGRSLSSLSQSAQPPAVAAKAVQAEIEPALKASYPALQARFVDVSEDKLRAALKSADSKTYPDLVVFEGFTASWPGPPAEVREQAVSGELGVPPRTGGPQNIRTMLLRRAPHPDTAKAFVEYLDEQSLAQAKH